MEVPADQIGVPRTCPACRRPMSGPNAGMPLAAIPLGEGAPDAPAQAIQAPPANAATGDGGAADPAATVVAASAGPQAAAKGPPFAANLVAKAKARPLVVLLAAVAGLGLCGFSCCGVFGVGAFLWPSGQPGEEYFPVSDKARWEYTIKMNLDSKILGKMPGNTGRAVVATDGRQKINAQSYYRQHHTYTGLDWENEVVYVRHAKDGIYHIQSKEAFGKPQVKPEVLPETRVAPLPMAVGKTWTVNESDGNTVQYKAEGIESVTVGGKTYAKCLKVTSTWSMAVAFAGTKVETVTHYAPGVGMVKYVRKETQAFGGKEMTQTITTEWTLDKYQK